MLDMHTDMEGSAVAVGSLYALHALRSPMAVDCWLAITENRIGPLAYKPQDVVRAHNGTTIQVIHTDAEGRMVLADALSLAAARKPRAIIDYATLTGACVYALTERYSGAFTNRPEARDLIESAGSSSGERVWCFPMDADFDTDLESTVADVMQCAVDGKGDHILAARFLSRFVPKEIAWLPPRSGSRLAPRRSCAHRHGDHRIRRALHARSAAPWMAAGCAEYGDVGRYPADSGRATASDTGRAAAPSTGRGATPAGSGRATASGTGRAAALNTGRVAAAGGYWARSCIECWTRGYTGDRARGCAARWTRRRARKQMNTLTLRRPDDWHVHLRDGAALAAVAKFTAERFGRAIVMPNLKPAIATAASARAYRERILAALPADARFEPLLTLYLTNATAPDEIDRARGLRDSSTASSYIPPARPRIRMPG